MTEKYEVTVTKKDGTTYHGLMTTKESRITNGLLVLPVWTVHGHI